MSLDQIKSVAVIGAGDMGHGIAEVALLAGYPVTLFDINTEAVEKGAGRIIDSVKKLAEKGRVPAEAVEQIRSQGLTTTMPVSRRRTSTSGRSMRRSPSWPCTPSRSWASTPRR